jgi:DNA-binding response OmpR family regulator
MDEHRREGMAAGAQAYLVKPSDINKLLETVRQLLFISSETEASADAEERT